MRLPATDANITIQTVMKKIRSTWLEASAFISQKAITAAKKKSFEMPKRIHPLLFFASIVHLLSVSTEGGTGVLDMLYTTCSSSAKLYYLQGVWGWGFGVWGLGFGVW